MPPQSTSSFPAMRTNVLQTYQLLLYRRALHPELFQLKSRRTIAYGGFEFEVWLMPGSHVLRMQVGHHCASELVTDQQSGLPTEGAVTGFPCAGEHDFDYQFEQSGIKYVTSAQTESLPENLYMATYRETVELAIETEGLIHRWTDADGGKCLSMLDVQRYGREMNAQSYHLIAQGGVVVRTQSLFRIR